MTMFRRMDKESTYKFLMDYRRDGCDPKETYIYVGGGGHIGGALRVPLSSCAEILLRIDISAPLKELLRAAIREGLLGLGYDDKELVTAGIRDKLKSRRAKGLSTDTLFGAIMVCEDKPKEPFNLSEDLKEIVYHGIL